MDNINLNIRNSDGVVYHKIVEAESLLSGVSNRHLERAWIYHSIFNNKYKGIGGIFT